MAVKYTQIIRERGFTFVELLIVIVVVGVLAALVLNSYAGVQAKGRDTTRQNAINAIAAALEACYDDQNACNGKYPTLLRLQDDSPSGWAATNLKDFNKANLYDVHGNKLQANPPAAGSEYQYEPHKADGSLCGSGEGQVCASYVLKAWQEQDVDSPYIQLSANN